MQNKGPFTENRAALENWEECYYPTWVTVVGMLNQWLKKTWDGHVMATYF